MISHVKRRNYPRQKEQHLQRPSVKEKIVSEEMKFSVDGNARERGSVKRLLGRGR